MRILIKTLNSFTEVVVDDNENLYLPGITDPTLSILQAAFDNGDYEVISDPEPIVEEPVPNWVDFNLAISFDQNMIEHEVVANQRHPSIVGKKDLAYTIIDTKGIDNFAIAFPLFCQIAEVPQEHRDNWANLAESFNLPAEFVTVVRNTTANFIL